MLFSRTSLLLAFTTLVAAAPYNPETKRWWHPSSSSNSASSGSSFDFYGSRRDHSWHGRGTYQQDAGQCNVNSVSMPQAPTPLPAPSEGLALYHVAVGRGTQNYTCDLSNSTAVPVAAGAVASLFNVTCLSADSPTLLSSLPNIALALPIPSSTSTTSPAVQDLSGHHYFTDATTAYFNLDTTLVEYGRGGFKKINATDAPADAMVGQNGKGYGAVAWLKLTSKESPEDCSFREVYRINTAGGQPPKTCTGQQAEFEVEYAAEYWFYS